MLWDCPAWQRRASTCGRPLLPHADKQMFVYVLELCKSEAKRPASTQDTALELTSCARSGEGFDNRNFVC
jgi:hypothetical protein